MHGDVVNAVADLGIRVGNVWRVPAAVDRHTWQEVAGLRGHGTGPMWQPGAGGLCFAYDYFGSEGCEADVSSPSRRRGRSERTLPDCKRTRFGLTQEKEKGEVMKHATKIISIACLIVFTMFAGSALAQEDEAAPDQSLYNRLHNHPPAEKTANSNASAAGDAQEQAKSDAVSTDATSTCAYTFTSGSGVTYLQFCVTVNGNIVEFNSPQGIEQIRQGAYAEGYGICDFNRSTAYYDFADDGDSGNWDAPVLISHNATSVKIARTTSDGIWTLTQTISMVPGTNPYAKVVMAIKNNGPSIAGDGEGIYLMRWADADPDHADPAHGNDGFLENFDRTLDAAWGYISLFDAASGNDYYGLRIENVGNSTPASVTVLRNGLTNGSSGTPDVCNPANSAEQNIDGSIGYLYLLVVNNKQTVTMSSRYISF